MEILIDETREHIKFTAVVSPTDMENLVGMERMHYDNGSILDKLHAIVHMACNLESEREREVRGKGV